MSGETAQSSLAAHNVSATLCILLIRKLVSVMTRSIGRVVGFSMNSLNV